VSVVVITDVVVEVEGRFEGERVLIPATELARATGWTRKPEGLCKGAICVPVRDAGSLEVGDEIDLSGLAAALGRRCVVDADAQIAAMSLDPADRTMALEGLVAPDLELPDLDGVVHRLSEMRGSKVLLVAFSSWCGCRHDLPGWQELADELAGDGLRIVTIALDDDPEVVRPFTDGIRIPVLLDRQHLVSEIFAVSNVPTAIWIDEEGRIARPNGLAFGSDVFAEFTGVESGPTLDAIRRWVRDGEVPISPEDAAGAVDDLTDAEIDARLHFRIGAEARQRGQQQAAERHLRTAGELAPLDFSVRRASMPLLDEDPFGDEFLRLYDQWQDGGAPYHGLPANWDSQRGSSPA
jgi:peroxiredoxin